MDLHRSIRIYAVGATRRLPDVDVSRADPKPPGTVTGRVVEYLLAEVDAGQRYAVELSGVEIEPRQPRGRSEEHTSELQSLMRISYAVFCLQKKTHPQLVTTSITTYCTPSTKILSTS